MADEITNLEPLEHYDINVTAVANLWKTYNVGAYSSFFAYDCCLVIGLVCAFYCDIPYIRRGRFFLLWLFEIIACALGISGYMAFDQQGKKPTNIAYSALVLVIFNVIVGTIDWLTRFHKSVHLFHALLCNTTLWVGAISAMSWYRDAYYYDNYKDIWVFSFIAMWSGAMIALPFPGFFVYLMTRKGMFNREAVDEEKEVEQLKKGKKNKKEGAIEMEPAGHFLTIHVKKDKEKEEKEKEKEKKDKGKKKKKEESDADESDSDEEQRKKKKKKDKEKPKEKEKEKEKPKKKEKETDKGKKDKEKESKKKDKEKDKEKPKKKKKKTTTDSDSD